MLAVAHPGTNWAEVAAIGTLVVALPVLAAVAVIAFKVYRRVHVVHEAVVGRPEARGREAIPSMIQRFDAVDQRQEAQARTTRKINARLLKVEAELQPNHGTSLRDAVDTILAALVETQVPPAAPKDTA